MKIYVRDSKSFRKFPLFQRLSYLVFEGARYFSWTARNLFRREAYELGITFDNWFTFLDPFPTSP